MKNIVLISLAICCTVSCKQKASKNKEQTMDSIDSVKTVLVNESEKQVETVPQVMAKDCNQTFDTFFEKFAKDKIFQKNRIKYPLKSIYYTDVIDDEPEVEYIDYESFDYIDFTKDKEAINNEFDKYEVQTEVNENNSLYKWLGIDNGIHVTYKFNLIDDCWYMVEILDEST
ncbi:DUF4348 domain-containing protein [Flagellimonas lutimaris]|uniref:DUF4348 domain-containing protein n=1 Tax=Flagellimonas lutimaris TaxID=475082 RepID=UPI003F5CE8B5